MEKNTGSLHNTIFRGGLHRINDLNVKKSKAIKLIQIQRIFFYSGAKEDI